MRVCVENLYGCDMTRVRFSREATKPTGLHYVSSGGQPWLPALHYVSSGWLGSGFGRDSLRSSGCQRGLLSLLKEGPTVFVAVFCPKLDARD